MVVGDQMFSYLKSQSPYSLRGVYVQQPWRVTGGLRLRSRDGGAPLQEKAGFGQSCLPTSNSRILFKYSKKANQTRY